MERIDITPRKDYKSIIEGQGFIFHDLEDYYKEEAAYQFSIEEINSIEKATEEIFSMCIDAVNYVIKNELWERMKIPKEFTEFIKKSWNEDWCSIYGRFDLGYNNGQVKLLEFNADTPTGLLETSVIQWCWLQDWNKNLDQFNSVHEKLVEHFKVCAPFLGNKLTLCSIKNHWEDFMNVKYIQECANQAGLTTNFLHVEDISIDESGRFINLEGTPLESIFKLYPWEWMFNEEFKHNLRYKENEGIQWIEPPYKSILSNKMLLVILYELFPNSPYILPCSERGNLSDSFVMKPIYSREGANIDVIIEGDRKETTTGDYGEEGYIYQEYFKLPNFNGNIPIIGSWLIGGQSAGIGIREGRNLVTNNTSKFVSHFIK